MSAIAHLIARSAHVLAVCFSRSAMSAAMVILFDFCVFGQPLLDLLDRGVFEDHAFVLVEQVERRHRFEVIQLPLCYFCPAS